jgi:hypothetical protein
VYPSTTLRWRVALAGAIVVSALATGMAAAAALERAATPLDSVLIVACAIAVTLAAQLLPALARQRVGWALWIVCLALTIYGHAGFFSAAQARAGAARSQSVQPTTQQAALLDQLRSTAARASSAVAFDLAAVRSRGVNAALQLARCEREQPSRCAAQRAAVQQAAQREQALQVEAVEAQQAAALRAQITASAAQLDTRRAAAAADPVAAGLAHFTGLDAAAAPLVTSVLSAVVVELLGAVLWAEALRPQQPAAQQPVAVESTSAVQIRQREAGKPRLAAVTPADTTAAAPPAPQSRWPPWHQIAEDTRAAMAAFASIRPTSTRSH